MNDEAVHSRTAEHTHAWPAGSPLIDEQQPEAALAGCIDCCDEKQNARMLAKGSAALSAALTVTWMNFEPPDQDGHMTARRIALQDTRQPFRGKWQNARLPTSVVPHGSGATGTDACLGKAGAEAGQNAAQLRGAPRHVRLEAADRVILRRQAQSWTATCPESQ